MKKLIILAACCLFLTTTIQAKDLSHQSIAEQFSVSICKKVVLCKMSPTVQTQEACEAQMTTLYANMFAANKLSISQSELSICLKSMDAQTCDQVKSDKEPPHGCSKMKF
jgi:hypothetical protein